MLSNQFYNRFDEENNQVDEDQMNLHSFNMISLPVQDEFSHLDSFDSTFHGSLDYADSTDFNSIPDNQPILSNPMISNTFNTLVIPSSNQAPLSLASQDNTLSINSTNTANTSLNLNTPLQYSVMNPHEYSDSTDRISHQQYNQSACNSSVSTNQSQLFQQTTQALSFSDNSSPTTSDSENQKPKRRQRRKGVDKLSLEEKKKKKEIRLARNRESAHRSRARHKEYVTSLEESVNFLKNKVNLLESTLMNYIGKEQFLQLFNPEYYEPYPDESETSSTSSTPNQVNRMFSVSIVFVAAFIFSYIYKPLQSCFPLLFVSNKHNHDYVTMGVNQSQQAFMFQSFSTLLGPQLLSKLILFFDSDTLLAISYSLLFAFFIVLIYLFIVPRLWWNKPRWRTTPRKGQFSLRTNAFNCNNNEERNHILCEESMKPLLTEEMKKKMNKDNEDELSEVEDDEEEEVEVEQNEDKNKQE